MNPARVIERKRDGAEVPSDELREFLTGYLRGTVADYHVSAFLMAVLFRGMSDAELATLLAAMIESGERVDFGALRGRTVDKHSTGGVGDKASLVLAPLAAALGVRVPMISGRGLGHTGGTLDKLEAIPGFRTDLPLSRFREQVERIGCCLIGQTAEIAPLDRRLYALRDVTATVESIPLIAASIMSKKLAEGIGGLVLDVKRGSGAFLPEIERVLELTDTMIRLGAAADCRVVALVTAMDRPLGFAVGNALETEEAILALRGEGPADLRELSLALTAEMLVLAGVEASPDEARASAAAALDDGRALEKMREILIAQGGDPAVLDDPALLPQADTIAVLESDRAGVIASMDVRAIGRAAVGLGAGRVSMEDRVDPRVGFHITAKPGMRVAAGEPLATIHAGDEDAAIAATAALRAAIEISEQAAAPLPLVSHRVTVDGVSEMA
ncbi:MAG TPA: thymidine phosphorylase [Longimicrobiales bacterium]|nr:thymidine phosphorylase [Longimicrobiales bacterium]